MRSGTLRRLRRDVALREGCERHDSVEIECAYCGCDGEADWDDAEPRFLMYNLAVSAPSGIGTMWIPETAHLDHVIPESRNGPTSLDNTVIACSTCNVAKGVSALGDPGFRAWLKTRRADVAARVQVVV